jgi:hypothetical protein
MNAREVFKISSQLLGGVENVNLVICFGIQTDNPNRTRRVSHDKIGR